VIDADKNPITPERRPVYSPGANEDTQLRRSDLLIPVASAIRAKVAPTELRQILAVSTIDRSPLWGWRNLIRTSITMSF
jgi:hypothetical protein